MTIALVIRVNDGFVVAADSATTMSRATAEGPVEVVNIYNNANKVFNLHKKLPIAAMTWGQGNIGPASISTLAKDLRRRLSGDNPRFKEWSLDLDSYSMTEVAERMKEFFFDEKYEAVHGSDPEGTGAGELGLLLAGYGAGEDQPELFSFRLGPTDCEGPTTILDTSGAQWWGQPEAIARVMLGTSLQVSTALQNLNVDQASAEAYTRAIQSQVHLPFVQPAMPIQDAIDLARFLVELTIQFTRFTPGHPTVGGPIEIAAITKHEGFRWVQRKHYFDIALNGDYR